MTRPGCRPSQSIRIVAASVLAPARAISSVTSIVQGDNWERGVAGHPSWRRQTATTCHDGCSRRLWRRVSGLTAGACAALNAVARQRLPPARRSGPSAACACAPPASPAARTCRRGTPNRARSVCAQPRFADQAPAEVYASLLDEGVYLLLDPHHVPHPGRNTRKSASAAISCAIRFTESLSCWRKRPTRYGPGTSPS